MWAFGGGPPDRFSYVYQYHPGRHHQIAVDFFEGFKGYLAEGEKAAIELEKALRAHDTAAAEKQYRAIKNNCSACHGQYRD